MNEPLPLRPRALLLAAAAAAVLRAIVLISSLRSGGQPDPDGYRPLAAAVIAWIEGTGGGGQVESPLMPLLWHNPAYTALVTVVSLLFEDPLPALAALQSLLGLASGWLVFALLRRRLSGPLPLAGALTVWFHPSVLFFEQQLSSVSLSTFLCAALAYNILVLSEQPERAGLQWRVGINLLPLPWLGTGGLLVVPVVAWLVGRGSLARCIAPCLFCWLPAAVMASLWLGMLTPLNLDVPTRLALGNNPLVRVAQGSLLGSPEAAAVFHAAIERKCGSNWTRERLRCDAHAARRITMGTIRAEPTASMRRSVYRVLQTWMPDRSLPDALEGVGRGGQAAPRLTRLLVALVLTPLHLGLLVGLGFCLYSFRRNQEVRFLVLAIFAWTLPVLLGVGATALRQPVLPWIVCAASLGLSSLGRRSGEERREGWGEEASADADAAAGAVDA